MKKVKKIIALFLIMALIIPCGALDACADETPPETRTYYFLAPNDWFDTTLGALNEDIGCYWWSPKEPAAWPGVKMTPAFDIGDNVFKITDVPSDVTTIIFNAYVDVGIPVDYELKPYAYQTVNINLEGYDKYEAEDVYEGCPVTDNFDNFIYVISSKPDYAEWYFDDNVLFRGAWFTLDNYKNYPDYYGAYDIELKNSGLTYYVTAPDSWFNTEKGAANSDVGAALYCVPGHHFGDDVPEFVTEKMSPAPEIGDHVFKIENVSYKYNYIRFYDYTDLKSHKVAGKDVYPSDIVSTRGYNNRTTYCRYDESLSCSSFNNMVYVFDMDYTYLSSYGNDKIQDGEWFTIDEYKNYARYYGSYGLPDSPEYDVGSKTYYFLVPQEWLEKIDPQDEFRNTDLVLAKQNSLPYDGISLKPAPEIGENVYVARGVSQKIENMRFVALTDDGKKYPSTRLISTKGYKDNCPYDSKINSENFDGWIYVLDGETDLYDESFGEWFTLDDYKNHADYYGTYGFETADTADVPKSHHEHQKFTLYFLAPDSWIKTEAGAGNNKVGFVTEKLSEGDLNCGNPGVEMTPAPEVGENVFKMSGILPQDFIITFNDYHDDTVFWSDAAKTTTPIEIKINENGTCPYDNMIYVMELLPYVELPRNDYFAPSEPDDLRNGKWFSLEDYKTGEYSDVYYGSYGFDIPYEMTYYFLAPDSWFDTEKGALNEDVCCSTYIFNTDLIFPGQKMTPAPEVGKNVFKVTLTKYEKYLGFNANVEDYRDEKGKIIPEVTKYLRNADHVDIGTYKLGGYHGNCPYDESVTTDNFNGWIYVLNCNKANRLITGEIDYPCGEWFTLENYKNYPDYYGTYTFVTGESEEKIPLLVDVDCDGVTTSNDAIELLRYSLDMQEYSNTEEHNNYIIEIADIDNDGVITSADALELLRLSVS